MQVFNVFMKVLRSKLPLALIYIWVFVAVAIVMTFSDNTATMFEQVELNVCIFDEDNTPESRALCDLIAKDNHIVELDNDRDTILDALYYERANYVLTIKKGYAEKLAVGETEGLFENMKMHDSYSTIYMGQFVNEYVGTVSAYIAAGSDTMTAISKADAVLSEDADVTVASFSKDNSSDFSWIISFYFRFLPYIMLGSVMNTLCPVLIVIGRKDLRFRTNCSGLPQGKYTAGLFAASGLYILAEWLLLMIVGMFINGGIYQGTAWIAVLNSFVFMLFATVLTILVASFNPGSNTINIMTQVISLSMSFLCGIFVELDMLGDGVIAVARFLPAYWYMRVNRMLAGTEPFDLNTVYISIALEAGFVVLFIIITVLVRRTGYSVRKPRTAVREAQSRSA